MNSRSLKKPQDRIFVRLDKTSNVMYGRRDRVYDACFYNNIIYTHGLALTYQLCSHILCQSSCRRSGDHTLEERRLEDRQK